MNDDEDRTADALAKLLVAHHRHVQDAQIIPISDVRQMLGGISEPTLWRMRKRGEF